VKTRVNEYCGYHGAQQGETYNYLYKRLHDVYGINVYRLIRTSGESLLDAIERYGHLDRIYALITSELHYVEE
jgi:anti-repressor protein